MSKRIKILTPRIYEHSDFFHDAVDFARENSLNTNELCLELSHYLVDNFNKVWKIEKPRIYKKISDLEAKLADIEREYQEYRNIVEKDIEKEVDERMRDTIKEFNLDVSNLKQQLAESEKKLEALKLKEKKIQLHTKRDWFERCVLLEDKSVRLEVENIELKQQLAEKEKKYEDRKQFCINETRSQMEIINNLIEENEKLKQQLAEWQDGTIICKWTDAKNKVKELKQQLSEKEEEIEDLENNHYLLKKDYIVDYFVSQTNEPMPIPKFVTNQGKISFAVEQLTQAKEYIKEKLENMWNNNGEMTCRDRCTIDSIYKELDNQIKQLKEGNNV